MIAEDEALGNGGATNCGCRLVQCRSDCPDHRRGCISAIHEAESFDWIDCTTICSLQCVCYSCLREAYVSDRNKNALVTVVVVHFDVFFGSEATYPDVGFQLMAGSGLS